MVMKLIPALTRRKKKTAQEQKQYEWIDPSAKMSQIQEKGLRHTTAIFYTKYCNNETFFNICGLKKLGIKQQTSKNVTKQNTGI